MRHHLFLSLACGLSRLISVTAQTASSTTDAGLTNSPTEVSSGPASQPEVTSTDSASDTGTQSSATSEPSTTTGGSEPTRSESGPPDVSLRVPQLHVGRIELDVDNLRAEVNLAAQVANLVELNAGVYVGVEKVNITIAEVDAELELVVRLGNLVDIVNRTLESLNLNPLLINILNEATELVDSVVGAVDGLLGSIVSGDSTINFLIDNLGEIVAQTTDAAGNVVSSIVGNYEKNMTYTGAQEILEGGLIQKTYKYDALNALVNIVFNAANQVVQAVVVKGSGGGGGGGGGSSTSSVPTSTASTSRAPTASATSSS
ncbi:hypothetical protein DL769_006738 [Monosporascus sp. CRB-8-3]|nr:hypothetical protein DL769_006738 [Monosporascus sp. CRB-8-3]